MTDLSIATVGDHPTIHFAAEELARVLASGTDSSAKDIRRVQLNTHAPGANVNLWLGLGESFADLAMPRVRDTRFDDAIAIRTRGASGIIAGNNPRSVLVAAYRYLHELGCRWVRPGVDGEYIPRIDLEQTAVRVTEAPSYRHRGVCIEGAVSYDHVRDLIDWLPKVGMNAYFIQFREGYTFFERWYNHVGNPLVQAPQNFAVAQAQAFVDEATIEIEKRDLMFHAVGHGWTCEPFGMRGLGWEYPPEPAPSEAIPFLAQVNGKRTVWDGIPLNTNLCYSNPEARRRIIDDVVGYANAHPAVDVIHFWLSDGQNNWCECANCRTQRPADWYVMLLNEVDAALSARNVETRIVFLLYFDLLWPPLRERLKNPDRFILMFAPITRTYSRPFAVDDALPPLRPFDQNKLVYPRSVEANVAHLRAWQAMFQRPVDSFDFDYHLMWDHNFDLGYMQMARVLHRDLQLLHALGLDGFNSCQTQRACCPTGFPMTLMAWTLWNREHDFDALARDYFAAAFGPDGVNCRAYLEEISMLIDPVYLRGEKPVQSAEAAAQLRRVQQVVAAFEPVITRNAMSDQPCWAASWRYLQGHAAVAVAVANALAARAAGQSEKAQALWQSAKQTIWELQPQLHSVMDAWLFTKVYERKFGPA